MRSRFGAYDRPHRLKHASGSWRLTACVVWMLACGLPGTTAIAQSAGNNEVWDGLASSFATPWQELLTKKYPDEWSNLLAGLSMNVAYTQALQSSGGSPGAGDQGARGTTSTTQLGLRYNPLSYWFATATAYHYLRPSLQKSWDPDFTYSFGYDDWHPYTLSAVYGNYGGNRFSANAGEPRTRFEQGTLTLAYKFPLPKALEPIFLIGNGDQVSCSVSYSWTPRYTDVQSVARSNKQALGLGCRYTLASGWYVSGTAYHYLRPGQQQPWDPDFIYGFGYFDWHSDSVSIQYNNYSGNRFPWKARAANTGTFRAGSVTISWTHGW